jgi:hypothetical protein
VYVGGDNTTSVGAGVCVGDTRVGVSIAVGVQVTVDVGVQVGTGVEVPVAVGTIVRVAVPNGDVANQLTTARSDFGVKSPTPAIM